MNTIGAAALLLWGMRMVRTGVTRAFGSDLRHAIGRSVTNRFSALLVGMGVTAVLQSSTATALMVASFAGRGLMATTPALAVMLGADIGTTLVAQVLSFDMSWASPMLILIGVVTHQVAQKTLPRQLARALIGLGLMLLALKLIVMASVPLRESQIVHDVFNSLGSEIVLAVLLAALLTWLAHSSLAVVLLVMSLASAGAVDPGLGLALVVGANVGSTLPPLLATLHEGPEAQRVTVGNAIFKLTGTIVLLPLIGFIQPWIASLEPDAAHQIVNFHTFFNVVVAATFLFLTEPVARLVTSLFPDRVDEDDPAQPRHLDRGNVGTPALALSSGARETLRMGEMVENMLNQSLIVFQTDNRELALTIAKTDDVVDSLHEAIKLYMTDASRARMDEDESRRVVEIMTFNTNLEHIGDIIENLMDLASKKIRKRMHFSDRGLEDIIALHGKVAANLKLSLGIFMTGDVKLARRLLLEKREVVAMEHAAAERHMARLMEGRPETIETSALHQDILRDLKRIHSHIVAVAYPVLEAAGELAALNPGKGKPKDGDGPETNDRESSD